MVLMVLPSATDIAQWADTRQAQGHVPELLRRLIYATTRDASLLDFPAGDAIQLEGVDGVVELTTDHAIVPKGLSVWEVGTSPNPKGKADEDYEKRTKSPPLTSQGT